MNDEPVIAQKAPYKVELLEGYRYAWCSCGLSKQQPFCDASERSGVGLGRAVAHDA